MNEEGVNETLEKTEAPKADAKEIEEGKAFAAVGYIWVLFLVPLLAAKENKFAKFHGKQGTVLFGAGTVCGIVAIVLLVVLIVLFGVIGIVLPGPLSYVGSAFGTIIGLVIGVIVFGGWAVLAVMGVINAFGGKYWKMPLFGGLAERINI